MSSQGVPLSLGILFGCLAKVLLLLCAREKFCDVYIRYQETDFRELMHEDDGNRNLTNLHV